MIKRAIKRGSIRLSYSTSLKVFAHFTRPRLTRVLCQVFHHLLWRHEDLFLLFLIIGLKGLSLRLILEVKLKAPAMQASVSEQLPRTSEFHAQQSNRPVNLRRNELKATAFLILADLLKQQIRSSE